MGARKTRNVLHIGAGDFGAGDPGAEDWAGGEEPPCPAGAVVSMSI